MLEPHVSVPQPKPAVSNVGPTISYGSICAEPVPEVAVREAELQPLCERQESARGAPSAHGEPLGGGQAQEHEPGWLIALPRDQQASNRDFGRHAHHQLFRQARQQERSDGQVAE